MVSVQHGRQNFYPRSPCGERPGPKVMTPERYYFYPRSPCGERHGRINDISRLMKISIHALLAESDGSVHRTIATASKFLSTLSLRRATPHHAKGLGRVLDFYPRSPCGERLCILHHLQRLLYISIHALLAESDWDWFFTGTLDPKFLSTLSLRRATRWKSTERPVESHFYPRSPCGERLQTSKLYDLLLTFLSTLSLRRATA